MPLGQALDSVIAINCTCDAPPSHIQVQVFMWQGSSGSGSGWVPVAKEAGYGVLPQQVDSGAAYMLCYAVYILYKG